MLSIENLSVTVGDFQVRDISLDVGPGQYFVLIGASGSGKSVLLETIAGHHRPESGRVTLNGRDITRAPVQSRGVALVYQDQNLFPHMSARRNIAFGLRGLRSRAEVSARVASLAQRLGVFHLLDRKPSTLSGGEAQRVALARALAVDPLCLLLDEPLSSIDAARRGELRGLLRDLSRSDGMAFLHVTHDFEEALSLGTRVAIMEDGRIRRQGKPEDVFRRPESNFEARMAGVHNFYRGVIEPLGKNEALFVDGGLKCIVATDAPQGAGHLLIDSDDVTVSNERPQSSARNCVPGTIVDISRGRFGVEVVVDAGARVTAVVTEPSVRKLGLECGRRVWISFKASAARFIPA